MNGLLCMILFFVILLLILANGRKHWLTALIIALMVLFFIMIVPTVYHNALRYNPYEFKVEITLDRFDNVLRRDTVIRRKTNIITVYEDE